MNNMNLQAHITISRRIIKDPVVRDNTLKMKVKAYLDSIHRPFSETEFEKALINNQSWRITLAGVDFIFYII